MHKHHKRTNQTCRLSFQSPKTFLENLFCTLNIWQNKWLFSYYHRISSTPPRYFYLFDDLEPNPPSSLPKLLKAYQPFSLLSFISLYKKKKSFQQVKWISKDNNNFLKYNQSITKWCPFNRLAIQKSTIFLENENSLI